MTSPVSDRHPRPAAGDDEGALGTLEELYERHAAAVFTLALRLLGSKAEAEDLTHDVFVGLPEALNSYREQGRFAQWLARITTRACLDRLRRLKRRGESSLAVDSGTVEGPDRELLEAERFSLLEKEILRLPEGLRAVLLLRSEGLSHQEIGATLGIRPGTSEVRLSRAVAALRRRLAKGGY